MNTAIYVRVSTQRQAQAQSIDVQLKQLQDYAQHQAWSVAQEHIFRDDGYSGARLKRPGLDRLRDQVAMAQIERLLVLAPDRLARNFVHQSLLVEELQSQGCQVEFLERPMSQDPHDQLLLQIRGAVAEYERTLISERMRRGRLRKLQAGVLLPWTVVPYGYRCSIEHPRDPTGVEIEPAQAAIVGEIFSRYVADQISLVQLSEHLHHAGVPSPTGKDGWSRTSLRSILKNPCYTGQVFTNRTQSCPAKQRRSALQPVGRCSSTRPRDRSEWQLVCQIPAIITQAQFEAAQVKLHYNQQTGKRNNKTHDYLLRSLVSCGHCQSSCFSCARGKGYRYYVCNRKTIAKHLAGNIQCAACYIPAQQLEELVWSDLCSLLQQPEIVTQAIERVQSGQWLPQELQARIAQLQQAQRSLQQQLERLTQAYLASVIELEEYQRRRHQLESQEKALMMQQQQLVVQAQHKIEIVHLAQGTEEFCQRVNAGLSQASFEQKRKLVELLIDRVIVTDDEVEIRYVIPTHVRGETTRFCHLRLDYFHPLPQQAPSIEMGRAEIEAFLTHLAVQGQVAASTQNQALSALLFLYREVLDREVVGVDAIRAKRSQYVPTVLTKQEAIAVIGHCDGVHQLVVKLLYGSGLRLIEGLRLRVKDVDFAQQQILVRGEAAAPAGHEPRLWVCASAVCPGAEVSQCQS